MPDLGVLLLCAVAAAVGYAVVLRRSKSKGAELTRALDAGVVQDVPGKMRLLDRSGLSRRWREGHIVRTDNGVVFRPRKPRLAASFDLSGTRAVGTRPAKPLEKLWFAGPTVLTAQGDLGHIEFGFGGSAYLDPARSLLT
jgi:hypothetical protein